MARWSAGVGALVGVISMLVFGAGPVGATPDGLTVSVGDAGAVSESGEATFTITLSPADPDEDVTVTYETVNGSATAGSDYSSIASGSVTFETGQTSKQVTVPILPDTIDEPDETFAVRLVTTTFGTISPSDGSGSSTIVDDDPTPSISINSPSVLEGDTGTSPYTSLVFSVTLSNPNSTDVTADWQTIPNGALSGTDYVGDSGTLKWVAGTAGSKLVTVEVVGDLAPESDEQLLVSLSSAVGATIPQGGFQGVGTIQDDDALLSINDAGVTEPANGSVTARFTVTLAPASARAVTVAYETGSGTATAGSDFTATGGTLTFAPGETSKPIDVNVLGDAINEPFETFNLVLRSPAGARIGDGSGQGTIVDPSAPPALTISDASGSEGAGTIPVTVTLAGTPSGQNVTINYAVQTGDNLPRATPGADFTAATSTLRFTPGQASKTISVAIVNDTDAEADENITVVLSNAGGATIAKAKATVKIVDNDSGPFKPPSGVGPTVRGGTTTPGPLPVTTPTVTATTTPKPTTVRRLSAKLTLAKINAKLVKGRRQVSLRVTLSQDVLATITMVQGKHKITSAQFQLIAGKRIVYVLLPKTIKKGSVRLTLLVQNARGVKKKLSTKITIKKITVRKAAGKKAAGQV